MERRIELSKYLKPKSRKLKDLAEAIGIGISGISMLKTKGQVVKVVLVDGVVDRLEVTRIIRKDVA